jgi:signal transduction histidine kinase
MKQASEPLLDPARLSATSRRMLELREPVLAEWERRIDAALEQAQELRHPVLLNTMPDFYVDLVQAISPGYEAMHATATTLASEHGGERARLTQFKPDMLILEYQLFKQTIVDVLRQHGVTFTDDEQRIVDASFDHAIREAVSAFLLVLAELREQFVAALTHDMRTPLSAAATAAQLIARTAESERNRELARKIGQQVERVDSMIRNLLDTMLFRQGERLQLHMSRFDIAEVADEVVQQATILHGDRCTFKGASLQGWWDRDAIKRALENLVGNAFKYGRDHSPVVIRAEERHERLRLSVCNEGEPIPADEQETVFQIFRRAHHARDGEQCGWGVGLPYVRAVAESHGGSITIDSGERDCTVFVLDIPVDARPFLEAPVSQRL